MEDLARRSRRRLAHLLESFRSPNDRGSFSVARFCVPGSLEAFTHDTVASYTRRFQSFRVVQIEPVRAGTERWIVEIDGRVGRETFRQPRIYARQDDTADRATRGTERRDPRCARRSLPVLSGPF